jgi:glycosyltransferase involved in cell wall biosynthesis
MPKDKIIYIKGGRAVEEAQRLFPRQGELPDGGPDKFLLAVIHHAGNAHFRLVSLGPETIRTQIDAKEVFEYGARANYPSKLKRRYAFVRESVSFLKDTIAFRPTRVLCGLDGPIGLFAWLAARLTGAQFVFLGHSALAMPSTSRPYKLANRFLCRHADKVIAHGPFVRDEAIRLGARGSDVIEFNNALDKEHIELIQSFPPKPTHPEKHVIVYVGRIEEDKGVLDLLEACRKLPDKTSFELRYIGEGSALPILQQRIEAAGLGAKVICTGGLPHEAVFRHLHQATVVATPSQSRFPEGFCKSVMEAFYVGTPVIAPDYGPFPYMVQNMEDGLLYSRDDINALSSALRAALNDRGLHEKISDGAKRKGALWISPETTFSSAVALIFNSDN